MSRSGSVKKFEFLRPFSKVTEKTEKNHVFHWISLLKMKSLFATNSNVLPFKVQMLTTSCQILTSIPLSFIKSLEL